jgi:hypothetical protein
MQELLREWRHDDAEPSDEVGARPHEWEVPPPAGGGEWRL